MTLFCFSAEPRAGTILRLDDQVYELRATEPHVRKDGGHTSLLVWEAVCPSCGGDFLVRTGLTAHSVNRRCSSCRKPHKPVKGKRGRKLKVEVSHA